MRIRSTYLNHYKINISAYYSEMFSYLKSNGHYLIIPRSLFIKLAAFNIYRTSRDDLYYMVMNSF